MELQQIEEYVRSTHNAVGNYLETEHIYMMAELIYYRLKSVPTEEELEDMICELHAEARDAHCR